MIPLCNQVTYVLLCEDNVYYVGTTRNLKHRIEQHFKGAGSSVTKQFKPVKLVKIYPGNVEKEKVLYGRRKYGVNKCYGYAWSSVKK